MPAIWAELVLAHFQRLQTRNAAQDFGSVSPAQSALSSGIRTNRNNLPDLSTPWPTASIPVLDEALKLSHTTRQEFLLPLNPTHSIFTHLTVSPSRGFIKH
ncbi:hypothetical protein J6590_023828 [Homalodisca vitripennis]|nr:hypothetical protein J6590_023828 [Homalodisca vitripennis]